MRKRICFLSFLLLAVCLNAGCASGKREDGQTKEESSLFAMNTYMTFTAYGDGAKDALKDSEQMLKEVESLWSVTDTESEIYMANHSAGKPVELHEETAGLIKFALEMAESTGGALEPTLYPLLCAWGFTTENHQVPAQEEIDRLLKDTDYRKIRLERNELTVPDTMQLDLGAVGKGYASDLVVEELKAHGVKSAVISLGGNIHVLGQKPDGGNWRVGIKNPSGDGNLGVLEASDAAIVTSGGYENYFVGEDGRTYWHILDPGDGYPANKGLLSVTIISPEGKLSDALSTALFVMGAKEAETYWRKQGGFDMILISDEGEILLTEGIEKYFSLGEGQNLKIRVLVK